MAAASGTTRVESADENREIHVNAWKVLTDPYVLDTPNMNNELVAQYPRFASISPIANVVPNAGTLAYSYWDWGATPFSTVPVRQNFNGTIGTVAKIPQITPNTEVNSVTGQTTSLYFPKGGLWLFQANIRFLTTLNTINTAAVVVIDLSVNSGGAFTGVARANSTQAAVLGPAMDGVSLSWIYYFTENNGTVERIRLGVASSQAMAGGVACTLNMTRLR